ncbi:hypothetical protein ACEWY4_023306 [Coilia grayii]|uniref:Band 3 cytoplasmic domain-containing protein n=1 Tax=Coilia grayii TaxID=363190 RepID=A0ABD1J655_9TELE
MDIRDQGAQMEPLLPTVITPAGTKSVRNDEEAVVDQGGARSMLKTNFEKEELEGHRTLYIGVHVPLGRKGRRRHRHHGHRHRKRSRERDSGLDDGHDSPSFNTPSQRVQFLLGTEDDDEEHIPHDLFTQLDEICWREGEDTEWRETARWLKFEEDVEDGGERWSKPYVATLSLHSLFELRSCILNGTVLLDMRANGLEEIADMVLDHQEAASPLGEEVRRKVREALLKQHHHQNHKKLPHRIPIVRSFADIGKKQSESHSMDKNGCSFLCSTALCGSLERADCRSDRQVSSCAPWSLCRPRCLTVTSSSATSPVPTSSTTTHLPPAAPQHKPPKKSPRVRRATEASDTEPLDAEDDTDAGNFQNLQYRLAPLSFFLKHNL